MSMGGTQGEGVEGRRAFREEGVRKRECRGRECRKANYMGRYMKVRVGAQHRVLHSRAPPTWGAAY